MKLQDGGRNNSIVYHVLKPSAICIVCYDIWGVFNYVLIECIMNNKYGEKKMAEVPPFFFSAEC